MPAGMSSVRDGSRRFLPLSVAMRLRRRVRADPAKLGAYQLFRLQCFDVIDERLDFRTDVAVFRRTVSLAAELETPNRHIAHQMRGKVLSSVNSVVNFLPRETPVVRTAQRRQVDGGIARRRAHRGDSALPVVAVTPGAVGEVVLFTR